MDELEPVFGIRRCVTVFLNESGESTKSHYVRLYFRVANNSFQVRVGRSGRPTNWNLKAPHFYGTKAPHIGLKLITFMGQRVLSFMEPKLLHVGPKLLTFMGRFLQSRLNDPSLDPCGPCQSPSHWTAHMTCSALQVQPALVCEGADR